MERKLYESFEEYLENGDFTHYEVSDRSEKEYLIKGYDVSEDPQFFINKNEEIEENGETYYKVNFGEDEESYMLEGSSRYMYFVYFGDTGTCLGQAYGSLEKAIQSTDGRTYEIID